MSTGPFHTAASTSQCHPGMSIFEPRRCQPELMRFVTVCQAGILLVASAASVQQAPTPTELVITAVGSVPESKPVINPAMVQSPAPVVPATRVRKQGASNCRLIQGVEPASHHAAFANRSVRALVRK